MPPQKRPGPTKKAPAKKRAAPKDAAKKTPAKKAAPKKAPAKKAPARKAAAAAKPSFGRPGTAGKAEGDAAVRAWMEGVRPEHRRLVERLDALVAEEVPDVKRAVKWSMPMYGREGQGWFAHVGSFKDFVALGFFAGAELSPPPPHGEGQGMRRVRIHGEGDLDERQLRAWVRQASRIKGWGKA